jgi:hypothetical protein
MNKFLGIRKINNNSEREIEFKNLIIINDNFKTIRKRNRINKKKPK